MDLETRNDGREAPDRHVSRLLRWAQELSQPAESYGLVLALILLAYVMISVEGAAPWWTVGLIVVQGLILFLVLRAARASPLLVGQAGAWVVVGTLLGVVAAVWPGARDLLEGLQIAGGVLLLVTPVVIVRQIVTHTVVTAQTVLGALCVYVLLGYCFAALYAGVALIGHAPFFVEHVHVSYQAYLFFSYTTLTTVGYGNLIPAENVGQTLAMLEALMGQIYLVLFVARLVSLWGQANPHARARQLTLVPPEPPASDAPGD
jgi:hypothetical protein